MKKTPPVSLIITTLNEASSILQLLKSIKQQVLLPDEVIIVDGGSTDQTSNLIKNFSLKNPKLKIKLKTAAAANISQGRNMAIKLAKHNLIAITDAGCVLDRKWLFELIKKYLQATQAEVVAGYYRGAPTTVFEEAVVPYVLVMSDRFNQNTFLPASRSMLLTKQLWISLNGFDENLAVSEDYDFAKRIAKLGLKIKMAPKAIVLWKPRSNLKSFITMVYRMAKNDVLSGHTRPKALFVLARYLLGVILLTKAVLIQDALVWGLLIILGALYLLWAIFKNVQYLSSGWYYLPLLQLAADVAVMIGTVEGFIKKST